MDIINLFSVAGEGSFGITKALAVGASALLLDPLNAILDALAACVGTISDLYSLLPPVPRTTVTNAWFKRLIAMRSSAVPPLH